MGLLSFIFSNNLEKNYSPPENYSAPEDKSLSRACPDIDNLINYGHGLLESFSEEYSEIENHIKSCKPCREMVEVAKEDPLFSKPLLH